MSQSVRSVPVNRATLVQPSVVSKSSSTPKTMTISSPAKTGDTLTISDPLFLPQTKPTAKTILNGNSITKITTEKTVKTNADKSETTTTTVTIVTTEKPTGTKATPATKPVTSSKTPTKTNKPTDIIMGPEIQVNKPGTKAVTASSATGTASDKAKANLTPLPPEKAEAVNNEMSRIRNEERLKPDENQDLLEARARFNLDGDANVFNPYLSYRDSIKDDPEKLKAYDEQVKKIMDKVDIHLTHEGIEDGSRSLPDTYDKHQLDESARYMIAANIVETYHNRPDLIDQVAENGLEIAYTTADINIGGQYQSKNFSDKTKDNLNRITLDSDDFWRGVVRQGDGYEIVRHEFGHAIDALNGKKGNSWGHTDGLLPGLTAKEESDYVRAREAVKKRISQGESGFPEHMDYGLTNDKEFLTTAIEWYSEDPESMKAKSPELYAFFNNYLGPQAQPKVANTPDPVEAAPTAEKSDDLVSLLKVVLAFLGA